MENENVLSLSREQLPGGDDRLSYVPDLGNDYTGWEVPTYDGSMGWIPHVNDQLPNGEIRDIRQERLNLDDWGAREEYLVIRDRLRDGLFDPEGRRQTIPIRFYQIPAPVSSPPRDNGMEWDYIEQLFRAKEAIQDLNWIREPEILLESGGPETMLSDRGDAAMVAAAYDEMNERYPVNIGFLLDGDRSPNPRAISEELPDGAVRKVREVELNMNQYDIQDTQYKARAIPL